MLTQLLLFKKLVAKVDSLRSITRRSSHGNIRVVTFSLDPGGVEFPSYWRGSQCIIFPFVLLVDLDIRLSLYSFKAVLGDQKRVFDWQNFSQKFKKEKSIQGLSVLKSNKDESNKPNPIVHTLPSRLDQRRVKYRLWKFWRRQSTHTYHYS